jgi:putative colanic acid biosysnthesis UDP-glucose lipid carrier transferase
LGVLVFDLDVAPERDADAIRRSRVGEHLCLQFAVAPKDKVASSALKRLVDLFTALIFLLLFLPAFVSIALIIKAESPGPVIFRQRRTGLNGKIFTIFKFRTMRVAEDDHCVRAAKRTDPRITWVGEMLRRTSLDEIPQLLNVLKGDMSIVGPRPHALAHDLTYGRAIPDYHLRFRVRPGITGLAQVRGLRGGIESLADIERRVAADNEYIKQWNSLSDFAIIFRTIPALLTKRNAY